MALLGTGVGVYVALQTKVAEVDSIVAAHMQQIKDLDNYDIILQNNIDVNKERVIRLETQMENAIKSNDRLASNIDKLTDEIRAFSNTLIKMERR